MYNYCWGAMIRILDVGGMLRRPGDLQVLWLPFDTCVSCVLGLRTAAGSFFFLAGVWTRISLFCRWPFDCCCCCCCRGQERDVPRLNWRHPDGRGHFHASHSAGATFILTFLFFFLFLPHHLSVMNDLFWAVLSSPVICIFHDRDVIPLVNALS